MGLLLDLLAAEQSEHPSPVIAALKGGANGSERWLAMLLRQLNEDGFRPKKHAYDEDAAVAYALQTLL